MDVGDYARLMVELADAGDGREALLGRRGLDEASWAAIDDAWQERLSEAMAEDGDGAPALVSEYTAAYEEAQRAVGPPMSLEEFARVTRLLEATLDVAAALSAGGVTLAEYLRASAHWARQFGEQPDAVRKFEECLRR